MEGLGAFLEVIKIAGPLGGLAVALTVLLFLGSREHRSDLRTSIAESTKAMVALTTTVESAVDTLRESNRIGAERLVVWNSILAMLEKRNALDEERHMNNVERLNRLEAAVNRRTR